MLATITICLFSLVFINLLLIKFSCNKLKTDNRDKEPVVLKPKTIDEDKEILAPTGS